MSLLWTKAAAFQRTGMAWHVEPGEEEHARSAKSVRHAGFAGYVAQHPDDRYDDDEDEEEGGWDENLWDDTSPDPTSHENAHHDEHGEYPESYNDRHDQAYEEAMEGRQEESEPDHHDSPLANFVGHHGTDTALWKQHATYGHVDLKQPVYATQSHVSQRHIDKYVADPGAASHHRQKYGPWAGGSDYLGDGAPMFVTHEGRLHATEGHHRTAAALQRGDSHIMGWHYDADKHGFPPSEDEDYEYGSEHS